MWFITIVLLILIAFNLTYILHIFGYSTHNIIPDLLINLLAGSIIFVIGINWDKIRSMARVDFLWLRFVFGVKSVENGQLNITVDTYNDTRPFGPGRYIKTFPDHHQTTMPGPSERLTGYCSVRAASYLIDKLSPYFNRGVGSLSDEEIAATWEGTFINIGVSALNIKTDDIKHHIDNKLFKEDINGIIELKNDLSFGPDNRHDVGMILKIKNPYFNKYSLIVCAGIGEWGTSGAAWYLSRHWKKLGRRFLSNDFIVVLNVLRGSDESASERYSSESWIRKLLNKIKN
ncbi:MAG: hypothetical protein ABFR82_07355 [Nitrospirota bacterium]